jgi:antitoxin YefM
MTAVTLDTARDTLADLIAKAWSDHQPVLITSDTSKPAVLVALDDFEPKHEIDADTYLRRSPENVSRINASIAQLNAGKGVVRDIDLDA